MRDAKAGTYNGQTTYCTVNAYGACPFCDQCIICHAPDPQETCPEWQMFFDSWDYWLALDELADPNYGVRDASCELPAG